MNKDTEDALASFRTREALDSIKAVKGELYADVLSVYLMGALLLQECGNMKYGIGGATMAMELVQVFARWTAVSALLLFKCTGRQVSASELDGDAHMIASLLDKDVDGLTPEQIAAIRKRAQS